MICFDLKHFIFILFFSKLSPKITEIQKYHLHIICFQVNNESGNLSCQPPRQPPSSA